MLVILLRIIIETLLEVIILADIDLLITKAIKLIQLQEPEEGYILFFSGGKESCLCKKLMDLAGVNYTAWYASVGGEDKSLLDFIVKEYPDVKIMNSEKNIFDYVKSKGYLPTVYNMFCHNIMHEAVFKISDFSSKSVRGYRYGDIPNRYVKGEIYEYEEKRKPCRYLKKTIVSPLFFWYKKDVMEAIDKLRVTIYYTYYLGEKTHSCPFCLHLPRDKRVSFYYEYDDLAKKWKAVAQYCYDNNISLQRRFKSAEEYFYWWIHLDTKQISKKKREEIDRFNKVKIINEYLDNMYKK